MKSCPRCGSTRRGKPRASNNQGRCLNCASRSSSDYYRRNPGYNWKYFGWSSRAEMKHAVLTARQALECEACGRKDAANRRGFQADHSNTKHGGTGRFRGVLCFFCNLALGFHERRGWPLTPWLAEYVARAAVRPLLEHHEDQLPLEVE